MAMNLRLPRGLDRRPGKLAVGEHTSKSALLLQGAELSLLQSLEFTERSIKNAVYGRFNVAAHGDLQGCKPRDGLPILAI